jgi:hypothetical protein
MDSQEWIKDAHSLLRDSGGFIEDPAACFEVDSSDLDVLATQAQSEAKHRGGAAAGPALVPSRANARSFAAPTPLGKHPRLSDSEPMSPALIAAAWAISTESISPERIEQVSLPSLSLK